jgi:hypothetical protein
MTPRVTPNSVTATSNPRVLNCNQRRLCFDAAAGSGGASVDIHQSPIRQSNNALRNSDFFASVTPVSLSDSNSKPVSPCT